MLTLQNINFSIAGRQILEGVDLQISGRQHVGLVGRNGSGKSTLFKIILGELESDSGKIQMEKDKLILAVKDFLCAYPKKFILISHDRDFLNDAVDAILH